MSDSNRLYYNDCYLQRFDAAVVGASEDGLTIYLDQTAFYPASGGQPADRGVIGGVRVVDVVEEDDGRVAHRLEAALPGPTEGESVPCVIDWDRRFDHIQQHTGQHLLSAVFEELYGIATLSFHMGSEVSSIELGTAALDAAQITAVEQRANQIVAENRTVSITYEDAAAVEGLRKASQREGTLRIVSIDGLDRSACGGTHVRRTGEIGAILIRKLDKVRGNIRVEFVCGLRAVARARAEFDALNAVARAYSCAPDEAPRIAAANVERVAELEKMRRRMAGELAAFEGKGLFESTTPGPDGVRRAVRRGPIGEDTRAFANAFTASGGAAVLLQLCDEPPSLLLCCSKECGINAGAIIKEVLGAVGGRGGGSATSAQGSVPNGDALALAESRIIAQWPS